VRNVRPSVALARKRVVTVKATQDPAPAEERRAVLRGMAAAAVAAGVQLAGPEQASAIQTRTTARPFVNDYERYKDRAGSYLGPSQMARIRGEFKDTVKAVLMEEVPKMEGAYPGLLKLAFLDAAPHSLWEVNVATGGANGSVRFSEELARPENAALKGLVDALEPVKAKIDSAWTAKATAMGSERMPDPISWADLIAMAACVATIQKWGGSPEGGFPVRQGRTDTPDTDPAGRGLSLSADAATAQAWFAKRGIKLGAMLPIWMEVTTNLDSVKKNKDMAALMDKYAADPALYQKGFITGFTQVTSLGSYYDAFAYFYDENPFTEREWFQKKGGF
jgi:hypothetical protein